MKRFAEIVTKRDQKDNPFLQIQENELIVLDGMGYINNVYKCDVIEDHDIYSVLPALYIIDIETILNVIEHLDLSYHNSEYENKEILQDLKDYFNYLVEEKDLTLILVDVSMIERIRETTNHETSIKITHFDSGEIQSKESFNKEHQLHGTCKYYYKSGKKYKEETYFNGRKF